MLKRFVDVEYEAHIYLCEEEKTVCVEVETEPKVNPNLPPYIPACDSIYNEAITFLANNDIEFNVYNVMVYNPDTPKLLDSVCDDLDNCIYIGSFNGVVSIPEHKLLIEDKRSNRC